MSDTTPDPGATTTAPVNEAIPTTEIVTPIDPATIITTTTPIDPAIVTTFAFLPSTLASTIVTSDISFPATTLSTPSTTTRTSTDGPFNGPPPFVTAGGGRPPFASGSGPPFFGHENEPQGLSTGAKAGIGVGVVALVFSILAVVLLIWRMKKKETNWATTTPEPLPPYTESSASNPPPPAAAAIEMTPKSAMKKAAPAPLLLNLRGGSGSNSPTLAPDSTERRRSYAMEGTPEPLVLSIWEPASKSANSSATNSPILGPLHPPKVHRKSNAGSRPRRKSNLAPVSEEEPESSGSRLALVRDDDGSIGSAPPTPRTPRSAAFHALTGGAQSDQSSPLNSSFTLEPVPPLPAGNISPVSSKFSEKGKEKG